MYPNALEYVCVYSTFHDEGKIGDYLDSKVPAMQRILDTRIGPEMAAHGFTTPAATFTYLNPDNSLTWTHTFNQL